MDAKKRCRRPRGSESGKAVLNEPLVRAIMSLKNSGMGSTAIARELDLKAKTIDGVLNGYTWNHVTGLPRRV